MRYIFTFLLTLCVLFSFAQTGSIKGKIVDEETGEGIPFANIIAVQNGIQKGGAATNFDGEYTIKPLYPGQYDIKVSSVEYNGGEPVIIKDVIVTSDQFIPLDVKMPKGKMLKEVIIYEKPLIEIGKTTTGETFTAKEIELKPARSIRAIAMQSAATDGSGSIKGERSGATKYIVDGRPTTSLNIPKSAIQQISVITGGVPAKYGGAKGGFVTVTTKGASSVFRGGLEAVTSQFIDPYGYNLFSGNLSGPILKKNKGTEMERSLLGFFVAGDFSYYKDPSPDRNGVWKVKDEVLEDLKQNPLRKGVSGGVVKNVEFVTNDDLENVKTHLNSDGHNLSLESKLNFAVSENVTVTFGGTMYYSNSRSYAKSYSLFNWENNAQSMGTTWSAYGRLTQTFNSSLDEKGGKEKEPIISNAYYTLLVDYSRNAGKSFDPRFEQNPFEYGYLGKFDTYKSPFYSPVFMKDSVTQMNATLLLSSDYDTLVTFEPGNLNPVLANVTSQYYDLYYDEYGRYPARLDDVLAGGGIRNGDRSTSQMMAHSLYHIPGRQYSGFGKSNSDQMHFRVDGSFDVSLPGADKKKVKHAIEFGVEFEQKSNNSYGVGGAVGLWELMRTLTNKHINDLDKGSPILVYDAMGVFQDTILYPRKYLADEQAFFDKSLRQALGLQVDGTDWIDIDALPPETFSMDMFSADDLINLGNSSASWSGKFDHLGNKLSRYPSFNDYFTKKDADGNYVRGVPASRPIYTAAYLQDNFAFRSLVFNIGLRVDRFDNNQNVLKDPYSLYAIRTRDEVPGSLNPNGQHPSHIGDDFAVYVDDFENPNEILGYRDGDTWFDENGVEVNDPSVIAEASSSGTITPYLVNPDDDIQSETYDPTSSFKDYEPQVTVQPRIAFSFPISDVAQFFAHYDVLTQRTPGVYASPVQYYFFEDFATGVFSNPDLKPEKTIEYEVGFKQKLSENTALTLSAFYREMRDMQQAIKYNYAYPITYTTFGNIDFGTVKGLTVVFELRRKKQSGVSLNANYTLQFAEGTGSSATSQLGLLASDQPNLKVIMPLTRDQRHRINATVDYRFGSGKNYVGPRWFNKDIFARAGGNIRFVAGSGKPYTRQAEPTARGAGIAQRSTIAGNPMGARLPWTFGINTKINKVFVLSSKGENNAKKPLFLEVYVVVSNLLNTKNITGVYPFTGIPDDDGWLTSERGRQYVADFADQNQAASYVDLYRIDLMRRYSPRLIRLGAQLNF